MRALKKIDSFSGRRICVTEHEGLRQAGRARQAGRQTERREGQTKEDVLRRAPPFPPVLVGKCQIRLHSRRRIWGGTALRPGKAMQDGLGPWRQLCC